MKTEILPDCHLGVWEITEDFDSLYSMVNLVAVEKAKLDSFKNISRKVEWLSVRALVKNMIGKDTRILYNSENKPFVRGNTHSISITHSNNLTAVIISKDKRVGIDLEFMSGKISKVAEVRKSPTPAILRRPSRSHRNPPRIAPASPATSMNSSARPVPRSPGLRS